eukprot:15119471-Heterocapsa_arctica.AAC.1
MFDVPFRVPNVKAGDQFHEDAFGFDVSAPSQVPLEDLNFELGGRREGVIPLPGVRLLCT